MTNEKIQKVLARAGYGSRRQIEAWIQAGEVHVNDHLATLGERIGSQDRVYLRGELCDRLTQQIETRVLVYHKPEGEICTRHDPEGRATVFDHLPRLSEGRWINVGRLDFLTSGLLLFTNDGELAHRLMHPSSDLEREYRARVMGRPTPAQLNALKTGVLLEDGTAHFETFIDEGGEGLNHWYRVTVREGRNRLVRRLFESQDLRVNRLIRVRFGSLQLPSTLAPGHWHEISQEKLNGLI
jgi:23S rRNA pseudouridine2605 synthase